MKSPLPHTQIGIIGLGYVGLPLAVEFGKTRKTIGFDINSNRVAELRRGKDSTLEVDRKELKQAKKLTFSTNTKDLATWVDPREVKHDGRL